MKENEIKEVERLLRAYSDLLGNCVDSIGIPKTPTSKQLKRAIEAKNKFESKFKIFEYETN